MYTLKIETSDSVKSLSAVRKDVMPALLDPNQNKPMILMFLSRNSAAREYMDTQWFLDTCRLQYAVSLIPKQKK